MIELLASSNANSAASLSMKAGSVGSFKYECGTTQYPVIKSSPIFYFEGNAWCLKCRISPSKDVVLSLQLVSCAQSVRATIDLSLLGRDGHPSLVTFRRAAQTFSSDPNGRLVLCVQRSALEEHLTDGCFTVHCLIFIAGEDKKPYQISSGLGHDGLVEHLDSLLEGQDMSDVTFEVDGETFHAHRLVLAARSPVFKAELFGSMVEAKNECIIKVGGINSEVFRVLLRYVYTDSIDSADIKVTQHLLEAADRYALNGLRNVCEERLCRNLTLDSVLSSLDLADQHNCIKLLDECLNYAAAPENLLQLTLSQEYLDLMKNCPSLFAELSKRASTSSAFINIINKKQRIV